MQLADNMLTVLEPDIAKCVYCISICYLCESACYKPTKNEEEEMKRLLPYFLNPVKTDTTQL